MGKFQLLQLLLTHPLEFATLARFYLYHDQTRDITNPKEYKTSGYDRESMKKCWSFLDKTSRSFSMVIKELDGELARVVSEAGPLACRGFCRVGLLLTMLRGITVDLPILSRLERSRHH
jgi:hypothetical protein